MKERFDQWMQGRNGVDLYSKFLILVALILAILNTLFIHSSIVIIIYIALVIYAYYRMLSKNVYKRSLENAAFRKKINVIKRFYRQIFGKDGYKYFTCPSCKSELRVPKKKGKIKVRCPKCSHETIQRS